MEENELRRAASKLQDFYAEKKWFQFVGIGKNDILIVYYAGRLTDFERLTEIDGYKVVYMKSGKPKPLSSTE